MYITRNQKNTNSVYLDELINLLKNSLLVLTEREIIHYLNYLNKNNHNIIECHKFIITLRSCMLEQSTYINEEIYKHIQHALQNNNFTINDLFNVFNNENHPDVIPRQKNEIIQESTDTLHMNRYYIYGTSYIMTRM